MRALYLLILLFCLPAFADEDALLLARKYMQAYTAMDYGELEQFYHFDAVFQDPSASVQGNSQNIAGRTAILEFLKKPNKEWPRSALWRTTTWSLATGSF